MTANILKEKLESALTIADIHAQRLTEVISRLTPLIPFMAESFSQMSIETLALCDMFVSRFEKLQGIMGAKLFGLALEWAEENNPAAFLDKLNALEKLGVIPDAHQWIELRKLRNLLSDDYPEEGDLRAEYFTTALSSVSYLFVCLENIKKFIAETSAKRY